ncbi:MAG: M20/M25/M40 family metallo-hydrolase [Gemmatimonadaceae bacterium]
MPAHHPLDPVALTEALVAIDSRNPDLVPGAPGERACAEFLAEVLDGWGFAVALQDVAPGRTNVVARIGPAHEAPLVLNGHLEVVGTDDMTHAPFLPHRRGGNLYGRGSTDMKGGVAAMCVAAARAAERGTLRRELILAAVCDEEFASIGTRALLDQDLHAVGAIITEPTRLAVVPAHKGFAWLTVTVQGRAAHGSRYDVGIDANRHAGLFLAALDRFEHDVLTRRTHPLLGRASVHAAEVHGGTGWSTYADQCTVHLERRTLPGESGPDALAEMQALLDALHAERPTFSATVALGGAQPPLDLAADAPLVHQMVAACRAHGLPGAIDGLSCWTDAALFAQAGIPALCFGPGDIARAHSATEWVEVEQIERATAVLESVCLAS